MNSIILLIERGGAWSPEVWAEALGGKRVGSDQVMIEHGSDWLSVIRNDQVLDDFDEQERGCLSKLLSEPAAYLIEWKGSAFVERLLRSIPPSTRAAVDNDHGLLVAVHQVAGEPLDSWVRAASLP